MSAFTLYPAIDLRGGRCVRLVQGDPQRQEVFSSDPAEVARRWVAEGAQALHVVDLDGAFVGGPQQLPLLEAIVAAAAVPVQFGGGLRSEVDVQAALDAGAARVVVGTRALEEGFFAGLVARWGAARIVAGIDARGDEVAIAGWQQGAGLGVDLAARRLAGWGAALAVYTQVQRDGMLQGPDFEGIRRVAAAGPAVIASGGVSSAEDVAALAAMAPVGVCGAILGRALYTGRITLARALEAAGGGAG